MNKPMSNNTSNGVPRGGRDWESSLNVKIRGVKFYVVKIFINIKRIIKILQIPLQF